MKRFARVACVVACMLAPALVGASSPAAAAVGLVVTPTTGLVEGQSVALSWSGLPDRDYGFLECDGPLIANLHCVGLGNTLTGSGSSTVVVHESFATIPSGGTSVTVDCLAITSNCNIAMFHYNFDAQTFYLEQIPISFANEVPRPTVSATPSTQLGDGQSVSVTLDGWDGADVTLAQCTPDSRCVPLAGLTNVVDGATAPVTVTRMLSVPGAPYDCMLGRHCSIRAVGTLGTQTFTRIAPIYFSRSADLSVTVQPKGLTGPGPVTVEGSGFATGFTYTIRQCTPGQAPHCGDPVPIAEATPTTLALTDSLGGTTCRVAPFSGQPCSVVLEGTSGAETDRTTESVSFALGVMAVSQTTGLAEGQAILVFGELPHPSTNVVVRQCLHGATVDVCNRGKKTLAFVAPPVTPVPTYVTTVTARRYLGLPKRSCLRNACRFELVVDGVVTQQVPVTFATPATTVSVAGVGVTEGSNALVDVRLARATNVEVRVTLQTENGSALAGNLPDGDYQFQNLVVVIPAGSTHAVVSIPVYADSTTEGDEVFGVRLHDPMGAFLPPAGAVATVTIHEPAPA